MYLNQLVNVSERIHTHTHTHTRLQQDRDGTYVYTKSNSTFREIIWVGVLVVINHENY
jgi:hypothetical protein